MLFFFDPSKWNKMFHDVSGSPKNPKIKGRDHGIPTMGQVEAVGSFSESFRIWT
jgi:hypothetical protein